MATRQERIEELKEQIYALENEERAEARKTILPLLLEKGKFIYDSYYKILVEIDNDTLKTILEPQNEGSFYHWRIQIMEGVYFNGGDGCLSLSFEIMGGKEKVEKETFKKCKELGIKIDFEEERRRVKAVFIIAEKEMNDLEEKIKAYNEN